MRCRGVGFGTSPLQGSAWLDRTSGGPGSDMGGPEDVAQVTPKRLTEALVAAAQKRGAELMLEKVRADSATLSCAPLIIISFFSKT